MSETNEADQVAIEEAGTTAPQVSQAPVSNQAARLEDIWPEAVSRWLANNIHNSPVARSTDALNHLTAALPALRQALAENF